MIAPRLFLGTHQAAFNPLTRPSALVLLTDRGLTDDGERYGLYAKTNRAYPAGPSGECLFTKVTLLCMSTVAGVVLVTPWVDGSPVPEASSTVQLEATPTRIATSIEVPLYAPVVRNDVNIGQEGLRGCSFQLEVSSVGDLVPIGEDIVFGFDGADLDFEVLRESSPAGASAR